MREENSIQRAIGIDSSCINLIKWPNSSGGGEFKWATHYGGEFFADFEIKINGLRASLNMEFDWNIPNGKIHVINKIEAIGRLTPLGTVRWAFFCPINKKCRNRTSYQLYINSEKKMACKRCAGLLYKKEMEKEAIKDAKIAISKNPKLITQILCSPISRIRDRIAAIDCYFKMVRQLEHYKNKIEVADKLKLIRERWKPGYSSPVKKRTYSKTFYPLGPLPSAQPKKASGI